MLAGAVFLTACEKHLETGLHGGYKPQGHPAQVRIGLYCEPIGLEGEDGEVTSDSKSAMQEAYDKTSITNATYFLVKEGTTKVAAEAYYDDIADFVIDLPDYSANYTLYLLANVGDKRFHSSSASVSDIESLRLVFSESNYRSYFNTYGFPMVGKIDGLNVNSSGNFPLKRLVHTILVKMDKSALSQYQDVSFTSVKVCQAALDVQPFLSESKATRVIGDSQKADMAVTEDELNTLNAGQSVTLYTLENMYGDLLSGNADWSKKIPSEIETRTSDKFLPALCTYLEISAVGSTASIESKDMTYRCYLGTSAANFDVPRSKYSLVNNHFTSKYVEGAEWTKEEGAETLKTIALTPANCYDNIVVLNYPLELHVETAIPYDELVVSHRDGQDSECDVVYDKNGNITVTLKDYESYIPTSLTQSSSVLYDDLDISIRSKDGKVSEIFPIKVQVSPFIVYFRTGYLVSVEGDDLCRRFMESKGIEFDLKFRDLFVGGRTPRQSSLYNYSYISLSSKDVEGLSKDGFHYYASSDNIQTMLDALAGKKERNLGKWYYPQNPRILIDIDLSLKDSAGNTLGTYSDYHFANYQYLYDTPLLPVFFFRDQYLAYTYTPQSDFVPQLKSGESITNFSNYWKQEGLYNPFDLKYYGYSHHYARRPQQGTGAMGSGWKLTYYNDGESEIVEKSVSCEPAVFNAFIDLTRYQMSSSSSAGNVYPCFTYNIMPLNREFNTDSQTFYGNYAFIYSYVDQPGTSWVNSWICGVKPGDESISYAFVMRSRYHSLPSVGGDNNDSRLYLKKGQDGETEDIIDPNNCITFLMQYYK